jgi:hypothetical protein
MVLRSIMIKAKITPGQQIKTLDQANVFISEYSKVYGAKNALELLFGGGLSADAGGTTTPQTSDDDLDQQLKDKQAEIDALKGKK